MSPATLHGAPTKNFTSTSLNGAIDDSTSTITLNSTTNLPTVGYLVINRQDGAGADSPSAREEVSYTGVAGSDVTGVTRAADGSTARSHADGSLVEPVLTVGMWNDQQTFLDVSHASDGTLLPLSTATITTLRNTNLTGSVASITTLDVDTLTITNEPAGIGGQFMWTRSGALATVLHATATDTHFPLMRVSKNLTASIPFVSLISAPSLAAFQSNILIGSGVSTAFSTIFSTKPTIDIGENSTDTAATPSVLSLTSLASGALLRFEIDTHGEAGGMATSMKVESR